jgi:hypothetical protein
VKGAARQSHRPGSVPARLEADRGTKRAREDDMSKESPERPRGEAAWKLAKKLVADNNDAAYARGRKERAAKNARFAAERRAAELQDRRNTPDQPGR